MRPDPRFSAIPALLLAACLAVATGCEGENPDRDGAVDQGGSETCKIIDGMINFNTAKSFKAGETHTDYICPRKDWDYYKVTVPAGHKLINIDIKYVKPQPLLNLAYQIYKCPDPSNCTDDTAKLVTQSPSSSSKGFKTVHCINPGTYHVVIKDDADSGYDGKDPYIFSYTTEADKDTKEVNDTAAKATTISNSATAYISCAGDVDYYKFTMASDQLLNVQLKAAASTTLDLKYTVYDSNNKQIASEEISDGTRPDAKLDVIHAVPGPGTYYIAVEDTKGDDADTSTSYTLTLLRKTEGDPQDKGTRNDSPAKATTVGTLSSGTVSKTFTGQIGSKADLDYFVIHGGVGASQSKPVAIEVVMTYSGGQNAVDPSFSYVFTDANTTCSKDTCCRVLKGSCKTAKDCLRKTYSCIKKGDNYCNDVTCAPSASATCAGELACAGSAECMPNKQCGAEHAVRWANNKKTAVTVKTSQMLFHPGPYYIRVSDLQSDEYEYGRTYTLKITAMWDPDGSKELDTEYFPDRCQQVVKDTVIGSIEWELHVLQAKKKVAAKTITLGQNVTGYLSYEGDIDFYKIANPCPNADCTLAIKWNASCAPSSGAPLRYCQDPSKLKGAMGLEFMISIRRTDDEAEQWTGFVTTPGSSGTWGAPSKCVYSYKKHGSEPYYITVEDYGNNYWSLTCPYSFSIVKVADGCAAPCKTHPTSGNCGA